MAKTSRPVQVCLLTTGTSLPSPRPPASNKYQKLEQLETEILLPTRAEQAEKKTGGHSDSAGEKGILLIRR